jgi:[acyl-carrier-protein] S-malonyltransferase/trans-AT polyketide synthase/acyltransferase/oxidoreductase domain-containing protein
MGKDFHDAFALAREAFAEASEGAGLDLAAIVFAEDDERLNLTEYTQPCILAAEIAMFRVLQSEFGLRPEFFAGHSLGEYTALVASGSLELREAARLVRRRGALMQQAVPPGEGAMAAVIGKSLDLEEIRRALDGLEVDPANHNSPSQIVISGSAEDVERARELLVAPGRRFVPLNVSAPFHSRFMRPVEGQFAEELARARLDAALAPRVASNFTGGFHSDDETSVRENLVRQISGTVRWVDNMRALAARADRIVEIGPARPLSGFFRELGISTTAVVSLKSAERALRGRDETA